MSSTTPRRRRNPEQTRAAIVDAALAEIQDERFDTTSKDVAARAGVSERSIFVHFASLDDLRIAVAREQAARVEAHIPRIDPAQPLAERIATSVALSETVYALQRNPRLVGMTESRRIPEIDASMRGTEAALRDCLASAFAPELATPNGVDTELLDVIDTMIDWSSRQYLAERRRLDEQAVSAVLTRALTELLHADRGWSALRAAPGDRRNSAE